MKKIKKQDNKKKRKVYVIGRPSLDKLSKEEGKAFYSTLLSCIVEYYNNDIFNSV